ncbi:MAG TPA: NifB/NifX family molybdenum-iron cluster-binding protein [Prolixibacteraceae bacterium]|nr:NifB/NifX family molybdenum-iron cluster-binding protein [Prolixibacteraceae bacterium]
MKIAVPTKKDNQIDDHFGHCEFYTVYTISEEHEIIDTQTLDSAQGCGCKSDIAQVLASQGVTVMLAGGIGGGAINVLKTAGINAIRGCSGNATEIVKQYISGLIIDSGLNCSHHDQDAEHVCNH